MTQISIPAQVVNGHLQHETALPALEGKHVIATITVAPADSTDGKTAPVPSVADAEFDPEPPPWLDVEHDVYFPITVPSRSLGKIKVRRRRGKPCIILPEELPDE